VTVAIAQLGYQPNELARGLKGQRSRMIGLVIADISNPFYADCAKAVEEVARRHDHVVVLCASDERLDVERRHVEALVRRQVDGLLLVSAAADHAYLRAGPTARIPFVALDRPIDGASTDVVVVQNRGGAEEATAHLIAHGHRRIAYIGAGERLYTTRERLEGYQQAMTAAGLAPSVRLDAPTTAMTRAVTREMLGLTEPPTAIFAMNNRITVGVLQALADAGAQVPRDMALIGFDDIELAGLLHPRLTVVRQPAAELGRRAAELLFERLAGGRSAQPQRVVLPTELVVRASCGCGNV
jgi:LacI family transcriptional regulator